jgi:hypothetical protein
MPQESYLPYVAAAVPARIWDPRLIARGAVLTEYQPRPGVTYYRLMRGEWLDPSQGKPTILVDVVDEAGKRLVGIPVRFTNGGETIRPTEAKPRDAWATDHPMHAVGCAYSVEVGYASDRVSCLGLGTIEDPDHAHHTGYLFVFQRTTYVGDSPPLPPPVIDPPYSKQIGR